MSKALYKNSIILFLGTIAAGFGAYLFQLLMGRLLSLQDFGTLAVLTYFFSFISVPASALTTITTRMVAGLKAHGNLGGVHYFMTRLNAILFVMALILSAIFFFLAPLIQRSLHLESRVPYYWYCFSLLPVFTIAIYRGVFPGLQRFVAGSVISIIEVVAKLILAVGFILLSFQLSGAVAAIVISTIIGFACMFWQLRDIRSIPVQPVPLGGIPRQYIFILVWSLALTALSSIDIFLIKRFFSGEEAGLYAGISILAKIIMFASLAVSGAMFPAAAELYESGNHAQHRLLLWKASGIMVAVASLGILVYAMVPKLVISILFGSRYLVFAQYLLPLGMVAALFSAVQLFATYFLSIRKRFFLLPLFLAPIVEGLLIARFHATIHQVIMVTAFVSGGLALMLLAMFIVDGYGVVTKPYDKQPL